MFPIHCLSLGISHSRALVTCLTQLTGPVRVRAGSCCQVPVRPCSSGSHRTRVRQVLRWHVLALPSLFFVVGFDGVSFFRDSDFCVFCGRGQELIKKLFKNSHIYEDGLWPQVHIHLQKFTVCPECSLEILKLDFTCRLGGEGQDCSQATCPSLSVSVIHLLQCLKYFVSVTVKITFLGTSSPDVKESK